MASDNSEWATEEEKREHFDAEIQSQWDGLDVMEALAWLEVMEALARAKQAQQDHEQKHDVQLEIPKENSDEAEE